MDTRESPTATLYDWEASCFDGYKTPPCDNSWGNTILMQLECWNLRFGGPLDIEAKILKFESSLHSSTPNLSHICRHYITNENQWI